MDTKMKQHSWKSDKNADVSYSKYCMNEGDKEEMAEEKKLEDCSVFGDTKEKVNTVVEPVSVSAKLDLQFRRSIIKSVDYNKDALSV
ncbi:MAG: hypothetical protein ACLR6B_03765 [Blautia sp.]